jgi:hypothetical protein
MENLLFCFAVSPFSFNGVSSCFSGDPNAQAMVGTNPEIEAYAKGEFAFTKVNHQGKAGHL